MSINGHPDRWPCHDCREIFWIDEMALFPYEGQAPDFICDLCLEKIKATFEKGLPPEPSAEFRLFDDRGLCVATASGPRSDAQREINHYAMQYAQDGPVTIREV